MEAEPQGEVRATRVLGLQSAVELQVVGLLVAVRERLTLDSTAQLPRYYCVNSVEAPAKQAPVSYVTH